MSIINVNTDKSNDSYSSNSNTFQPLEISDSIDNKKNKYHKIYPFYFKDGDPVFVIGPQCI